MKSLNTLFTVLIAILMTAGSAFGQYVTVGTGNGTNGTTVQGPINIFYRSLHYQTIYTVAELQAAGFAPGAAIQEMGWDVTAAPLYAMPNYTIAMGHTTNATSGIANYVPSSTLTQVYTNALYAPVAGGFDMLPLSAPFIWNGVDNIVVDVCFAQTNPTYDASGQVTTFTSTNGSTSIRSDGSNQCGLTPNATHAYKPVVQFLILNGVAPSCSMVNNDLVASNVTAFTADLSWTHPGTPSSYIIEYGPAGFIPGTGTVMTTTSGSPALLTNLNPAVAYSARVQAVCGTAVGDTSYARAVSFTTLCATFTAPHLQTFGGGVTPNCWTQNQTGTSAWLFSGTTSYSTYTTVTPTSVTADGSHFAWLDFSYTTSPRYLTTNEVDVSTVTNPALSFWFFSWSSYQAASAENVLLVEAADGAGGWDTVTTIVQDANSWQFKLYDLAPYTYGPNNNLVQIRFNGIPMSSTGTPFYNDFLIDNVKFDAMPTAACAPIMAPDTTGFEDGGVMNACWEQSTSDVFDWLIGGPGGTPSTATGPSGPNSGTYYAYIESSPSIPGDSAILVSPPINAAMLDDAPALYFTYHMRGNDYMRLRVEYEIFGSDSWNVLWQRTGQLQTVDTDPYEEVYVPMPNAVGSIIRLRFVAVVGANDGVSTTPGSGFASDIAIDDIRVQNVLADDVAVTDIITPGNSCGLGVQPVTIQVTNRGFNPQSNIPVFVSVNGGTEVGTSIPGPIAANNGTGTATVLVDMTALGNYTINVRTALSGDEVASNNMKQGWAYHQPDVAGQYDQVFEGTDGYWYADGDWEHGTPAGTVITGAGAGSEAFVTNLSGNYTDAKTSYLYSPCFNISTMTQPIMRFSINWDIEDDYDGAWLDYSTDGGATWTKLGTNYLAGQNWYNDSVPNNSVGWAWSGTGTNSSGGWIDAIIDLQPYGLTVGNNVRFRFAMYSDISTVNEGLGIDNFGIFDGCIATVLNETLVNESVDGLADGSITLNPVAGFGGYSFNWSNGSTSNSITGLAPGTYDVTVTDQYNCSNTGSFTIISVCPASLGLSATTTPTIGDNTSDGSAEIIATGGTAPYTYSWSNGATANAVFNLPGDSLIVTVTDANGCTDMISVVIETTYEVGTENIDGLTGLLLSPNPAKDYAQLNINFNKTVDLTVSVLDVTGRVLETRHAGNTMSEEMRFDVSNLAQGVYFMQITADGQTATQRFVVVK